MATEELQAQIERLDKIKAEGKSTIILLCDPWHLPEFHRLHIEEVQLNGGDLYKPPGSDNYALHLAALERLGSVAGVNWISSVTDAKVVTSTMVHYVATGFYTREYGVRVSVQGEGMSDLDVIADDLRAQYEAAARQKRKDASWVEYCVDRDFRAKRKKRLQLARAEAHAQVYRKLLGLGGTYPAQQFKAPIVVVRCVVAPDYKDPETRKLLREGAVQAALGLYGGTAAALPAPEPATPEAGDYSGADTEVIEPEYTDYDAERDDEAAANDEFMEDPIGDELDSERADFEAADDNGKREVLERLISQKGYSFPPNKKGKKATVETIPADRLEELYDKLVAMDDDDIPF